MEKTDNELIAKFMGIEPYSFVNMGGETAWRCGNELILINNMSTKEDAFNKFVSQSSYDISWDWLMPVVDKIEKTTLCPLVITWCARWGHEVQIKKFIGGFIDTYSDKSKIEAVYNAVTKFIKWYNENKQP